VETAEYIDATKLAQALRDKGVLTPDDYAKLLAASQPQGDQGGAA
jgi:hypothetical protein